MSAESKAERTIVRVLKPVVGESPIILCGSRATGEATISSDYDLFVLLPPARIPRAIPRLRRLEQSLERHLGAEVSLNPLPRFRIDHPGRTLLVWKLRREGRVLSPEEGFELSPAEEPALDSEAASSYALSGLHFLIDDLVPADLSHEPVAAQLRHAVRKALLHASQLTLIRNAKYASGLREAVDLLDAIGATEFGTLAAATDCPETWVRVRDLLRAHISEHDEPATRTLIANGQYVALSTLRGQGPHLRALASRASVRSRLAKTAVLLAGAVRADGSVDPSGLAKAGGCFPAFLRPKDEPTWTELRDALKAHRMNADPLVGL